MVIGIFRDILRIRFEFVTQNNCEFVIFEAVENEIDEILLN
jgi:hypothetical protein